jgi:glycosyltransferase involved in cell wall biosynthesis
VNPENVFDIARGIREVLAEERLREELIARGHRQARSYNWERTAREVMGVYAEARDKVGNNFRNSQ